MILILIENCLWESRGRNVTEAVVSLVRQGVDLDNPKPWLSKSVALEKQKPICWALMDNLVKDDL